MKKSTRILLMIVLTLVLIAITVPEVFSGSAYRYADAGRYTAGEGEISGSISAIDLSWINGDVSVVRHSGDRIILKENASRRLKQAEEIHWLVEGETLYVRFVRSGTRSAGRLRKDLTLMIPEDLTLEVFEITTVSAEVNAELPAAEVITIQGVSGNMDMIFAETERVEVDTVSGDLTLRFPAGPERIDVDVVSADVTIQLPREAGFTADLDSISGDLAGQLLDGTAGEKHYVHGDGACIIEADAVSGNLTLDPYIR